MGKVLEPATSAALHVGSLTPLSSCNSRTQVTLVLPRSAGLKIFSSRRPAAGISPHSPFFHRRGTPRGIVCEQGQQEVIVSVGAVNEATWKELVLDCDIPVLVDFWAPWCGPCRMIAPLVDELAKLYAGRVRCLKLNTDESPNKATEYGIRSIPTVLIFKKGPKD
ncbi:hypothetical protein KP509_23G041700 [Ceratopteris richardii]|uniref:Thioredoxin domain-containing protein n=1 Tax=Ceratopteris richardii TaxID=49495 RepID=A0A8T2RZ29_CERRI|nr:hypothetical protein KP509_23G041700 [Ceratopteris richardii]